MKQKIVIKLCMPCDKCRTKAMALVAKADGLISVTVTGEDKLEVVGDDSIDPVCLASQLRRKVGYAKILQVEEVKDKKPEQEKKPSEEPTKPPPCPPPQSCYGYGRSPPPLMVCDQCEEHNNCAIM